MKIAIPVDINEHSHTVSASFGRAAHFFIYDEDTGTGETIVNMAAHSAGGAGSQAAQAIADSDAKALLTPRCGQNAANVLLAAGIRLYKAAPGDSAMDSINALHEGKLEELQEIHEGFHGHQAL